MSNNCLCVILSRASCLQDVRYLIYHLFISFCFQFIIFQYFNHSIKLSKASPTPAIVKLSLSLRMESDMCCKLHWGEVCFTNRSQILFEICIKSNYIRFGVCPKFRYKHTQFSGHVCCHFPKIPTSSLFIQIHIIPTLYMMYLDLFEHAEWNVWPNYTGILTIAEYIVLYYIWLLTCDNI